MNFFEINNVAFHIWDYPISYIELIGTLFGLISVYFASKANILTWGTGIVNEFFLFILFFQVQLYADMFLQIYFFIVTIYGWYKWKAKKNETKISELNLQNQLYLTFTILSGTIISGFFFTNIHLYLPDYFKTQADYPFTDSFVMVLSIVSTILLANMKIETWYLWILVDFICVLLYFKKEVYFLSLEYLLFLGIALHGLYHWKKQLKYD